jgi:hypothetical protein
VGINESLNGHLSVDYGYDNLSAGCFERPIHHKDVIIVYAGGNH